MQLGEQLVLERQARTDDRDVGPQRVERATRRAADLGRQSKRDAHRRDEVTDGDGLDVLCADLLPSGRHLR